MGQRNRIHLVPKRNGHICSVRMGIRRCDIDSVQEDLSIAGKSWGIYLIGSLGSHFSRLWLLFGLFWRFWQRGELGQGGPFWSSGLSTNFCCFFVNSLGVERLVLEFTISWCCLYDLGVILLVVANHEQCRLEEGIRRDGERGPVGNIENGSGNFKWILK